jgi:membrane protease subunit (stomatin/prohibitin family)
MQPALGRVALQKVAYDQLPLYTKEISDELNKELSDKWENLRGINVVSFTMQSVTPDDESAAKIAQFQESRVYTDAGMMGARMGSAQASAMEKAAENEAGAMTGFLGMGFAQNAGGANAAQFYQMASEQKANQPQPAQDSAPAPAPVVAADGWTCSCGAVNKGKFCSECGAKKPEGAPTYQCDKCGWVPEDPTNPPKFCPECGDKFDDADKK